MIPLATEDGAAVYVVHMTTAIAVKVGMHASNTRIVLLHANLCLDCSSSASSGQKSIWFANSMIVGDKPGRASFSMQTAGVEIQFKFVGACCVIWFPVIWV